MNQGVPYLRGRAGRLAVLAALLGTQTGVPTLHGAQIIGLGYLQDGFISTASGVSADGSTVVGWSVGANGTEAFRWTQGGGMQGLGDLLGGGFFGAVYSVANGVSADGSTVVGYSQSLGPQGESHAEEAFRWTSGVGMQGLGYLTDGGFYSRAYGVSADGGTVVGEASGANGYEAIRWMPGGGMQGLGYLTDGGFYNFALGVSADGGTVVGSSSVASGSHEGFRWTPDEGMAGLGYLQDGFFSTAYGVSADGITVVGSSSVSGGGQEAFRWTPGGGMQGLGHLPGDGSYSRAHGVSADGNTVVGTSGHEAFLWKDGSGMSSVAAILQLLGADLSGWSHLQEATAISPDGRYVVGSGQNTFGQQEAFLADLGPEFSAVPEGSTTAGLLGLGLTALALGRWRRRKAATGIATLAE